MGVPSVSEPSPRAGSTSPPESPIVHAASVWTGKLARTLKNCRLYDAGNPAVLRLREELATSLVQLLDEHGPLTLRCTSSDILCGETSLYPARSRDDNLGMVFFRDGIHSIVFSPGIDRRETDALLDALLQVTGRAGDEEDLVTLLWDADLAHVSAEVVQTDMAMDGEGSDTMGSDAASSLMPWPGSGDGADAAAEGQTSAGDAATEAPDPRSDDWLAEEKFDTSPTALSELQMQGPLEIARLREEYDSERAAGLLQGTLTLACECLEAESAADEDEELSHLLVRLLQEALMVGAWPEARRAAELLSGRRGAEAAVKALLSELCQPESVITSSVVREADGQGTQGVQAFLALARELGPAAVEWLMRVLAESRQQRTRLPLAHVIAELCRDDPRQLATWLADPRWYVVRNVTHMLGCIGGPTVVGLLQSVAAHADPRVRREVVSSLSQVERSDARDVLLRLLGDGDTRVFCAALHQLSSAPDAEVARILLEHLQAAGFHDRPAEERRAVFSALARVAQDEVLPRLEAELNETRRFAGDREAHRMAVAHCISHIGSPAARGILERGLRSRNRRIRSACEAALAGIQSHD